MIYKLVMLGLYGHHYSSRCRAIAELIPRGASVLDLCCGPAMMYRHLSTRSVEYLGIDINPGFIERLRRAGGRGRVQDLRAGDPLPPADYVILQAGLYHFLPDPSPLLDRMLGAAKRELIVAEPIRNLACSRLAAVAWLASRCSDPGIGPQPRRFSPESLDLFFTRYAAHVRRSFLIPGGREKVFVLEP